MAEPENDGKSRRELLELARLTRRQMTIRDEDHDGRSSKNGIKTQSGVQLVLPVWRKTSKTTAKGKTPWWSPAELRNEGYTTGDKVPAMGSAGVVVDFKGRVLSPHPERFGTGIGLLGMVPFASKLPLMPAVYNHDYAVGNLNTEVLVGKTRGLLSYSSATKSLLNGWNSTLYKLDLRKDKFLVKSRRSESGTCFQPPKSASEIQIVMIPAGLKQIIKIEPFLPDRTETVVHEFHSLWSYNSSEPEDQKFEPFAKICEMSDFRSNESSLKYSHIKLFSRNPFLPHQSALVLSTPSTERDLLIYDLTAQKSIWTLPGGVSAPDCLSDFRISATASQPLPPHFSPPAECLQKVTTKIRDICYSPHHPTQLLATSSKIAALIDTRHSVPILRGGVKRVQQFASADMQAHHGLHSLERFYQTIPSKLVSHQFYTLSDNHLLVYDIRSPAEPILQLEHHLSSGTTLLANVDFPCPIIQSHLLLESCDLPTLELIAVSNGTEVSLITLRSGAPQGVAQPFSLHYPFHTAQPIDLSYYLRDLGPDYVLLNEGRLRNTHQYITGLEIVPSRKRPDRFTLFESLTTGDIYRQDFCINIPAEGETEFGQPAGRASWIYRGNKSSSGIPAETAQELVQLFNTKSVDTRRSEMSARGKRYFYSDIDEAAQRYGRMTKNIVSHYNKWYSHEFGSFLRANREQDAAAAAAAAEDFPRVT